MRISASWFGSTVLLGPPHGRTWQRSATGSGLRLVSCSLRCAGSPGAIAHWLLSRRAKKEGCDRPVLARLIMPLRSRYRAVRIAQLSVAAGRDRRNTRAVRDGRNEGRSLPSALVACQDGSRGVSTSYLVTLLSARKKEMFVAKFVLDIKVPMEVDVASVA